MMGSWNGSCHFTEITFYELGEWDDHSECSAGRILVNPPSNASHRCGGTGSLGYTGAVTRLGVRFWVGECDEWQLAEFGGRTLVNTQMP